MPELKKIGKDKIAVSAVQMDCITGDKERNLSKAFGLLDELKGKADIACFPELFTTGYNLELIGNDFHSLAEPIPGGTTELMARKARELGLSILGTIVERAGNALYDTTFIIDKQGELIGKYRKSHLYPKEHRYFKAGEELPVFEVDGIKVGVAICFEHAFPQIFTTLALKGVQATFIPSAVPVGYDYLLHLRTRARAQDNQLFVVAVNRVGREGDVRYCGRSLVVNPRGEVIAEASSEEEILVGKLDLGLIAKEREQEPILQNLRPELYTFIEEK
ncbi:MAG: carbon-nitrogen hydrolase family protein [Candidatus Bipolaricaulota bacterium]|nr:carbon-nitrogen hydrolase family protein [Candidatus Bipolaricaulota bacterium]